MRGLLVEEREGERGILRVSRKERGVLRFENVEGAGGIVAMGLLGVFDHHIRRWLAKKCELFYLLPYG